MYGMKAMLNKNIRLLLKKCLSKTYMTLRFQIMCSKNKYVDFYQEILS